MFNKEILLILLAVFANYSMAVEIELFTIKIPGLHQTDRQGKYDLILAPLETSTRYKFTLLPPTRAFKAFKECQNCCLSPANKDPNFYAFNQDYSQSQPMGIANIYIWSKPNEPALSELAELANKKVGLRSGMPYGQQIENSALDFYHVDTIEQNIKKMQAGRIDAFIAYTPDAYNAFANMNIKPFPHAKQSPLATHSDRLVCKDFSPEFIDQVNNLIAQ